MAGRPTSALEGDGYRVSLPSRSRDSGRTSTCSSSKSLVLTGTVRGCANLRPRRVIKIKCTVIGTSAHLNRDEAELLVTESDERFAAEEEAHYEQSHARCRRTARRYPCAARMRHHGRMPTEQRALWASQARAALIIAATRRTLLTYGELGMAIGVEGVTLRNQLRHVLDDVSRACESAGEASLAALVVNAETGKPGAGWTDGVRDWHQEVRKVFEDWAPK